MDNSEIIGTFFVVSKIWFLGMAVMILLIISFFFIAVVQEVYCYGVTRHKQAMFVSERLLIQTRPEKKHMP